MTEFEVIKTANEISNRQLYPDVSGTGKINGGDFLIINAHNSCSGIRLKDAYPKLTELIFQRRRELEALENAELFLKHYIK
jgi:hypothetical protein